MYLKLYTIAVSGHVDSCHIGGVLCSINLVILLLLSYCEVYDTNLIVISDLLCAG